MSITIPVGDLPSKPVYLHFLDRELLTSIGVYDTLSPRVVFDDLRFILLSTYEPCYLSISLILENKFANLVFNKLSFLFQRGHVETAIKGYNLREVILEKRDQYPHAVDKYPFYFDDTWKRIDEVSPFYRPRIIDTGTEIENSLVEQFQSIGTSHDELRAERGSYHERLVKVIPHAIEALRERHKLAVTRLLFDNIFERLQPRTDVKQFFYLKISEHYIRSYLSEYGGTIATGLTAGIDYFGYICPTFPLHHISLWRAVYLKLGCLPLIRGFSAENLAQIRESPGFLVFVDTFRAFMIDHARAVQLTATEADNLSLSRQALINYLEQTIRANLHPPRKSPEDVEDFLLVVGKAATHVRSIGNEAQGNRKYHRLGGAVMTPINKRDVFVVYGRDDRIRKAVFDLLRAADLNPKEFLQIVYDSGSSAPFVGDAIDSALSRAAAIVVLLTGDDMAHLRNELLDRGDPPEPPTPQPRPNVLFEAGLALGKAPTRTVLVQIGKIREISDLAGRHIVRLRNTPASRKDLLLRLKEAGCDVNLGGDDWMTAGKLPR